MIKPETETELAEIVRAAQVAMSIEGGATRGLGAGAGSDVLSCAGLSGVTLYEPGALTLVARAGTSLQEVETLLAQQGQCLAFEPYDMAGITGASGLSTLGGIFASNASGVRRIQAGAARDSLLGVRFVDGMGRSVKNGGRVMKNVTGYDLVKLMAGSYGRLGVLSEVSLKVMPRAQASWSIYIHGLNDHDAVRAMSKAMGTPYDVSGAIHLPHCVATETDAGEGASLTALRIEGFEDSARYRAGKLQELLKEFGDVSICEGDEIWSEQRRFAWYSKDRVGAEGRAGGTFWQLSVKPSDAPDILSLIKARYDISYSYDWAGGRVWIWAALDPAQKAVHVDAHKDLHNHLQALAQQKGGHATLMHTDGPLRSPRFQPLSAPVAKLTQALREKFDPRGIFNPHLTGG